MYGSMRRGTVISALLHIAVLLALIISFPSAPPAEAPDVAYSVDMIGTANAPPQMSKFTGKTPAPDKTPVDHQGPQADHAPKPRQIVAPPPPPPPPPPTPQVTTPAQVTPKLPTPPPPPPTLSPDAVPTPPVTPVKPQHAVAKPKPQKTTPPAQHPVAPNEQSVTHQQHDVKKAVPLSSSIMNNIENLHALQPQTQAPTNTYNPDQGGAQDAGGTTQSTANSQLTGADKNAIGAHLHPCFNVDAGAPGVSTFHVLLDITTDATGTIRQATIDPQDQGKLSDPLFNAYATQAQAAAMDYQCATLPLPKSMLGSNQNFQVEFVGQ